MPLKVDLILCTFLGLLASCVGNETHNTHREKFYTFLLLFAVIQKLSYVFIEVKESIFYFSWTF
jgi:CRISPR/Cas system endoribonuclease Cas6 (RAMP superfamily)